MSKKYTKSNSVYKMTYNEPRAASKKWTKSNKTTLDLQDDLQRTSSGVRKMDCLVKRPLVYKTIYNEHRAVLEKWNKSSKITLSL